MKPIIHILILASAFLFVNGCKGDDDEPTVDSWTIGSDVKFEATIDGSKVAFSAARDFVGISVSSTIGTGSGPNGNGGSTFIFGSTFSNFNSTKAVEIEKGKLILPEGGFVSDEEFVDFFQKGNVPFSEDALNGMSISYLASDGSFWSTSNPPADQTGSDFNFNVISDFSGFGVQSVKYFASFNCTLYDTAGNSIALTNGRSISFFGTD